MTLERFLAQHAPREAEICDETITVRDIAPALDAGGHKVRVAVSDRDTGHAGEVVTCFRSNEAGFGFRG
jgi:hypothetical protein